MSAPFPSATLARWLAVLTRPLSLRPEPPASVAVSDGVDAVNELTPREVAARFRDNPDFYLAASIGDDDVRVGRDGRTAFALEVRVARDVIATVRGGSISIARDGEKTAEIAHFSVVGAFRRRGLGTAVARALFRWLHRRHGVTRMLFVSPVQRTQRIAFRAFVDRIGAEPWGHFADDPVAPPMYAWSVRRAGLL